MPTTPSALSYGAIRDYAEMVGKHYNIHAGDSPADMAALVRQLGGKIVYADTSESLHVDGRGDFTIFLPESTSVRRDKFTLAHELGHYFLHYVHQEQTDERRFERGSRNTAETQANVFAASLLMPEQEFRSAWSALGGATWQLAERFGVSPAAVTVRCQVLGLAAN